MQFVSVPEEGVPSAHPDTRFPEAVPVNAAVIVPAEKLPDASRETSVETVFAVATAVPVGSALNTGAVEKVFAPVIVSVESRYIASPSLIAVLSWAFVKLPSTAALPTEVTCPVRFAFVVTVAAFPEILVWSPVFVPDTAVVPVTASVGVEVQEIATVLYFPAVMSPVVSAMVAALFCMSFPVVVSNRAIALSVAEAGQTTSPVPAPSVPFNAIKSQYVTSVGRFQVVIAVQI